MRKSLVNAALLAGMLMVGTPARAAVFVFATTLAGANENPPVASPGTGTASVTIDNVASTMRVQASFADLLATTTAAHIHCCALPPANVGVATQLPSFVGFPLGVTAGTLDQTYDMTLASSFSPGFITANGGAPAGAFDALQSGLFGGQAYFNIHTSLFPGGEIRGQLQPVVPEPATWALTITGFALAGAAMRRRRRSTRVRFG